MAGKDIQRDLMPGDLVKFKRPHLDFYKELYIITEVVVDEVFMHMCKAAPMHAPTEANLFYPMEDFELV